MNGKRKAAPTIEPVVAPASPKHVRENDDDQDIGDFFDGYDAAMLPSEKDDESDYDFSDFVNLWTEPDLKADAKEEALYNTIYYGANIVAATV